MVFDGLVFVLVNGKLLGFDVRFFWALGGTRPNDAPIVEPRTFLTVALLNSFLDTKMLQLAVAELTGSVHSYGLPETRLSLESEPQ